MQDERCPHQENAVGWALHALEVAEQQAFETHLPTCVRCHETVRATEEVGAVLGSSVPLEEPPAALRDRLLDLVDRTPRTVHTEPSPAVPSPAAAPISLDTRRRVPPTRRLLLAAAAVAVIALGAATTVLGVKVSQLTNQQQAQAVQQSTVSGIVADPSARRAVLNTSDGKPAAVLVIAKSGAAVVPLGLAPNGTNQTYVFWGLPTSGSPQPLTVFDVHADSAGPETVNWPATTDGLKTFAISLEPGHTMPATPTTVVASGAVA